MRNYNVRTVQTNIEKAQQTQSDRADSAIPGVSNFYLKSGESYKLRFLTNFDLGLKYYLHEVWLNDRSVTYACEKTFNDDPLAHCPICQYGSELPPTEQGRFKAKMTQVFLVYVHDWQGKTYESNGVKKASNVIGLFKVTAGGKNGLNWQALKSIDERYGGLPNVDIIVSKTGKGLDTVTSFKESLIEIPPKAPGEMPSWTSAKFDWSVIPQEVVNVLPPSIDRPIDFTSTADGEIVNQWGDFYIKAGRFKMPEEFKTPTTQAPSVPFQQPTQQAYSQPAYTQPAYAPQQPAYQVPDQSAQQPPTQPAPAQNTNNTPWR